MPDDFTSIASFQGILDGAGHSITGNAEGGLISSNQGTIKNVDFIYPEIDSESGIVDPMVGYNEGELIDCTLTAEETTLSDENLGKGIALVGTNTNVGVIQYCSVNAQVTYNSEGNNNTYFTLLSGSNGGRIQDCSVVGELSMKGTFSGDYITVGALVGYNAGNLTDCMSLAAVSTAEATFEKTVESGMIIGSNSSNGTLDDLYCLSGSLPTMGGISSSSEITSVQQENIAQSATFPGLDFSMIWKMGDAYPILNAPGQRQAGVTTVEARVLEGKGNIMLGRTIDLREHAELYCNNSASVPVTNAMMDMTPLYAMKEAGSVTLQGEYNEISFAISLEVTEPKVTSIEIHSAGGKTSYLEKECYTSKGLVLNVQFEDEYFKEFVKYGFAVDLEGVALKPEDDEVIITYGGKTIAVPIKVRAKSVTDINILQRPKGVYEIGEKLDLSDTYLEICYDTGEVFYTTYEDGKEKYDLRMAVVGDRSSGGPDVTWDKVDDWLQEGLASEYDGATGYIFSGDPGENIVQVHAEKMFQLQVGWRASFRLIYEDGSAYLRQTMREMDRLAEADAKGYTIDSVEFKLLEKLAAEKDGIIGLDYVQEIETNRILEHKKHVYYDVTIGFDPQLYAKIEYVLPDGVSLSSGTNNEIASQTFCETMDDVSGKVEEVYSRLQSRVQLGLEGDKLVKLTPGTPVYIGSENDDQGNFVGTIYRYQIPFTKSEIDLPINLSFEYSRAPNGAPSLPASLQNATAQEAGKALRAMLEQLNQNTTIEENGITYVINIPGLNVTDMGVYYNVNYFWSWTQIGTSNGYTDFLYNWGENAPVTIQEAKNRRTVLTGMLVDAEGKEKVETVLEGNFGIQPGDRINDICDGKYGYWTFDGYNTAGYTESGNIVTVPGTWTWTPYYYVSYDWGTNVPEGQILPQDEEYYYTEDAAKEKMDESYKEGTEVSAETGKWTFSGWTASTEGTDVIFTGNWTFTSNAPAKTYTVVYNWGEEAPDGQNLPVDNNTYDSEAEAIAAVDQTYTAQTEISAADGTWTFSGWTAKTSGTTVTFTGSWAFTEKEPEEPAVTYTVVYDWGTEAPDGQELPVDTKEYATTAEAMNAMDKNYTSGKEVSTADGVWVFSGWTAKTSGTTVTFTGSWTFTEKEPEEPAVTYTVVYDWGTEAPAGQELPVDTKEYATTAEAMNAMDKTYASGTEISAAGGTWTFSGWTAETSGTAVIFTGNWTFTEKEPEEPAVTYTVVYDWGTKVPAGQELPVDNNTYGSEAEAKAAIDQTYTVGKEISEADGTWTFSGWTAKTSGTTVTFTGSWTFTEKEPEEPAVTYTVVYDWGTKVPAGQELPVDNNTYDSEAEAKAAIDQTYTVGKEISEADGTWTFSGWTAVTEDTTVKFTGSWRFSSVASGDIYTIVYHWGAEAPDGQELPVDMKEYNSVEEAMDAMDKNYTSGKEVSTAEGVWVFSGWTAETSGTAVIFTGNWTFTANPAATYQIAFDANGGICSQKTADTKEDGTLGSLPTPTYSGYRFKGWYTEQNGGMIVTGTTVFDSDQTVYAQWEKERHSYSSSSNSISDDSSSAPVTNDTEKEPEIPETKEESAAEKTTLENVDKAQAMVLTIDKKEMTIFGNEVENDVAPIIRVGRTALPIRSIAEALGSNVIWNEAERKVTITKGEKKIEITIGQDVAYVNGKAMILDATAFIENNRTYLPLRFVAENLDATVLWSEADKQVIIVPKAEVTEIADKTAENKAKKA